MDVKDKDPVRPNVARAIREAGGSIEVVKGG